MKKNSNRDCKLCSLIPNLQYEKFNIDIKYMVVCKKVLRVV